MTDLTAQQKKALSRKANISVTAGAGTGKTLLLVERYIDILLREDADVKDILAITFTKKAAAEMQTRVAERIDELLRGTLPENDRKKLRRILDRLNSATISTIHSFCARILRDFPVESGLDPDFRQISEMQQQLLIEESIHDELAELDQAPKDWMDLYRLFGEMRIIDMLHTALAQRFEMRNVTAKFDGLSSEELFTDLIKDFYRYVEQEIDPALVDRICRDAGQISAQVPTQVLENDKAAETATHLSTVTGLYSNGGADFWHALFDMADFFTTAENQAYIRPGSFGPQKLWGTELAKALLTLSDLLVPVVQKRITVPGQTDQKVLEQLKIFYRLYLRVEVRYREMKNDLAMVDFDDLQIHALDLLQSNESVRNKLADQYRFIMVDEFQDTNILQWEIIRHLGDLKSNKFFIVGDPKQSIYGFRSADIRVFNEVKNAFLTANNQAEVESDIVLSESFRFAPRVGDFINHIFSGVLQRSEINPWEVEYHHISGKRDTEIEGQTEFHFFNEEDQAEFIAARVMGVRKEYQFGKMAVLLRTRTHLSEVEEALRHKNIPFRTVGGIGFYQRQEIYDIYHLIRFMINPDDNNALVGILRSPLANISDEGLYFLAPDKEKISYWRRILAQTEAGVMPDTDFENLCLFRTHAMRWLGRREHIPFHELLYTVFQESGYRAALAAQLQGERYTANLDKILELAADYESSGFLSLTDFADSLQNLIDKQDKESEAQTDFIEEDSVKIMTIHQAKGLQFDVVFLPYLEQELRGPIGNQSVFDGELGIATAINYSALAANGNERSYYLRDLIKNRQRQKDLAEMKRLFYVGCTRAKDQLILSARCKNNKFPADTAATWLADILKIDPENAGDGEQVKNVMIGRIIPVSAQLDKEKRPSRENLNKLAAIMTQERKEDREPYQLVPLVDQPEGEIFSATQIMTFRKDINEYLQRYHNGFFSDDYDIPSEYIQDQEKSLLLGKIMHKLLEQPSAFDCERVLYDLGVTDKDLTNEITHEMKHVFARIENSKHLSQILQASESRNEVSLLMRFGSDYLSGTIDRIYRNTEGNWHVVDYKTNHISSARVEETAKGYQIQMDVYALLLSCVYPEQEVFPVSLYFTHPDILHELVYSRDELDAAQKKITSLISDMKKYDPYGSDKSAGTGERFAFAQHGK